MCGGRGRIFQRESCGFKYFIFIFFLSLRKRDRGGCSFNVRDSIHPLVGENGLRGTATTILSCAVRRPFVEGCRSPKSRRKRSMTRESPRQRGSIADLCVYIRTPTCVTSAPPPLFLCFTPSRIRCVGEEKDRCLSLPLLKATAKKRNIIEEKSVRTTLCPTRLQIARFPFRLISVEIKLKCLGSNSPH